MEENSTEKTTTAPATGANSTLSSNATTVDTSAAATTPAATATATQESAITNPDYAAALATPGALEPGSPEHQKLTKTRKSEDRKYAYERMEKKAAKQGGMYTLVDPKTGEKVTKPVGEIKALIEANNAQGVPMDVKGAGKWGGNYLFQPTGKAQPQAAKTTQSPEEKDKGGVWNWMKRNWYWVLGALAAVGVGLYFLLRKKKDKATPASLPSGTKPVDPGKDDPGKDDPGKDDPGKDDPGKDDPGKDDPGKDDPGKDDPGKDGPTTPDISDGNLNDNNDPDKGGPSDGPDLGGGDNSGGDNTGGDTPDYGDNGGNSDGPSSGGASSGWTHVPDENAGSDAGWEQNGDLDIDQSGSLGGLFGNSGR